MTLIESLRRIHDDNQIQIEQCASGCVSGTLAEWPSLDAALKWQGIDLPPSTHAGTLNQICQLLEVEAGKRNSRLHMHKIQEELFNAKHRD